ncbi:MAG: ABC transporter ATP-binding protein [Rhizobiales bacterium PAR1]|nr:MAG: ABC transporter ATP-binding protein [Rhizobiales bacterium PAR1]
MSEAQTPHLAITDLNAWYGESHVLHGITLDVKPGELVTLIGRNGAGKTTTLRSIMGMLKNRKGSVRCLGQETIGLRTYQIARLGLGFCPEDRGIFASLDVQENLMLPPVLKPGGMSEDELFAIFPNLKTRFNSPGTKLSGGEQQMLAIARILRTGASLLLLDEPTEGLAPVIVKQIGRLIGQLKARGFTIILVEQNIQIASQWADRHFVLESGRVVDQVEGGDLTAHMPRLKTYLGV